MKCPKCGFNSFEYYDNCKKCFSDLTGYKKANSITPLVLPSEARGILAAGFSLEKGSTDQTGDLVETSDDIFSFELPDEITPLPANRNTDPFGFAEPSPDVNRPRNSMLEDDVFADLLEATSHNDKAHVAFAKVPTSPNQSTSAVNTGKTASEPGEFDLESFSWDDTPTDNVSSDSKETDDGFDSLFNDTKVDTHK